MKYIISVIASQGYETMKDIWIHNFSLHAPNNMELYFIYGKNDKYQNTVKRVMGDIYDFYGNHEESFSNICKKTLEFFEFINDKHDKYVLLRTNVSTMFNLPLLKHFMNHMSVFEEFVAGTLAHITYTFHKTETQDVLVMISGTNLCISKNIVEKCIQSKNVIEDYVKTGYYEDAAISKFILQNLKCQSKFTMSRIDIGEYIELHHCENAFSVFCFRFKSNDREIDVQRMYELLRNEFDIQILKKWGNELDIAKYIPE